MRYSDKTAKRENVAKLWLPVADIKWWIIIDFHSGRVQVEMFLTVVVILLVLEK